ncbi:hypothetical protein LEMLEM_LOCUS25094 [Lemmus lemmus]
MLNGLLDQEQQDGGLDEHVRHRLRNPNDSNPAPQVSVCLPVTTITRGASLLSALSVEQSLSQHHQVLLPKEPGYSTSPKDG